MRIALWSCVAFLLWGLTGSQADAFLPPCPPPCCVTYQVAYQAREVTAYRPEWREEKVPYTVHKVNYRQEVTKEKVKVYVPKVFDEKVKSSFYVAVPKVVERDVTRCVTVPIVMVDPCTGCCFVSGRPQLISEKIKCTVFDHELRVREDNVKVHRMVPEDRVVDRVRHIPEVTQEQRFAVRRYCVMVPYKTTVYVPIYVPCHP